MNIKSFEKLNIPDVPGVYFWKKGNKSLYIGKATSLHDRVRSYFSNDLISTRGPRMVDMVFKADSIDWQETDSVLEALIAEANAIKKYLPDYNVKEKDDRSWNYIVITREKFPRILIVRGKVLAIEKQKKDLTIRRSFGPFTNGMALREALKIVRKTFPFIDKNSSSKYTNGFYRQLGLAPDISNETVRLEYKNNIDHIILFFEGKKKRLIAELKKEMNNYAKKLQFEKAGDLKHKIFALEHIQDVALIKEDLLEKTNKKFRIEAYDVAHISGKNSVGVMVVIQDGELAKNEYRKFKLSPTIGNNDVASLKEILERRFNHDEWAKPNLIIIDGGLNQRNMAEKICQEKSKNIDIVSIVKDERHKPKGFIGNIDIITKYKKNILLINNEAHRFAIAYHRKLRRL